MRARFVYTPTAGYSGKDAGMIWIRATKGEQKRCSSIGFLVEVRNRERLPKKIARREPGGEGRRYEKMYSQRLTRRLCGVARGANCFLVDALGTCARA